MGKIIFQVLALSFLVILISGCIQTNESVAPKRIDFVFNVDNVGKAIGVNQDSLLINEFKLLADKFQLVTGDDVLLETEMNALILAYSYNNQGEDELVFSAGIGYEDFSVFKGLELFIDAAEDQDALRDADFFGQDSNYSVVIKGVYNGDDFTYKSAPTFLKLFEFEAVEISETKETLVTRVLLDVHDVFIDEAGNLIDPTVAENQVVIDSLIQTRLELEAFAAKRFF